MNQYVIEKYFQIGKYVKIFAGNFIHEGVIKMIEDDCIVIKNEFSDIYISIYTINSIQNFKTFIINEENKELESKIEKESNSEDSNLEQKNISITAETYFNLSEKYDSFEITDIPWKEDGLPDKILFKGRDQLIQKLIKHYVSIERTKTFMLYGLTRTGKSSILKYFDAEILNIEVSIDKKYKFIPFIWDLSRAASQTNAKDMWNYLIGSCTSEKIKKLVNESKVKIPLEDIFFEKEYRNIHLRKIIIQLKKNGYFPIILIDEFSYYENLLQSRKVDNSFIQNFRQLSFDRLACFVYAGAYSLKTLLRNEKSNLTGQLVNTKEEIINGIDSESARELINVFEKVKFNEEATFKILKLTNKIPYFIQIICKNIGYYCVENKLNDITIEEVNKVVSVLTGEEPMHHDSLIERLSSGTFDSNQYEPSNQIYTALLSSIAFLEKDNDTAKGVSYDTIAILWNQYKVKHIVKLSSALEDLIDRGIITEYKTSNSPLYYIGVDLFRKWIRNENSDIDLVLGKIND